MSAGDVAVRIKGVGHQFGEAGETQYVRALADTSLDIMRGELLCLIGPSGCGKSTLLNVVGGLMDPTNGSVEVVGTTVAWTATARNRVRVPGERAVSLEHG